MSRSLSFAPLLAALLARTAGAQPMLRGPHPFVRQHELSVHAAASTGYGDSFGGTKLLADYGYMLTPLTWLDIQLNVQRGDCRRYYFDETCGRYSGDAVEVLGGLKWKFRTDIPVVPYAKAGAGFVFLFPDQVGSTGGIAIRGAAGLHYFFFDWLGVGGEAGLSLGQAFYDDTYTGSRAYSVFDFGIGVELQF